MNFNYLFNKYIIWVANTPKNKTYAGIISPSKNNIPATIVETDNGVKYLIKILTKLIKYHQF